MASHPEQADLSGTADLTPEATDGTVEHATGGPPRPAASGTHPLARESDPSSHTHDVTGEYGADVSAATLEQGPRPTAGAARGTAAERFPLNQFHARGGMGEIWIAADKAIGRSVAVKKMRPGLAEHHQQAFLLEAQITGQLEHPGVVPVHELGRGEDGQPYYVMKFVHGSTLEKVIQEYHRSAPQHPGEREVARVRLLQIFVSLCQTIGYAHSRRVIHRDIKPENVMIGPYGETLVLDWGLAKVVGQPEPGEDADQTISITLSGESYETAYGTIKGTPGYMSPESAEGDVTQVDEVSDIYLLGGTLYHILTGRRPRKADKIQELVRLATRERPVAPRRIDPSIPRPLEAICEKAMAMAKRERYQTTMALAEDVQRYLAGEPVGAYRESLPERAWRWARRHSRAIGRSLAVAGLVGLVAFGLSQWRRIEAEREQERQAAQEELDRTERERAAARAEADRLAANKKAESEAKEFRDLAEEARFFAANSDPVAEQAPFFDPERGLAVARKALGVAERWGPTLAAFPLADDRERLIDDVNDLLLLTVQVRGRQPDPAGSAKERLALLDRAAGLRPPASGHRQLRADALRAAGDADGAAKELAKAGGGAATAMDHFLRAERLRTRPGGAAGADDRLWRPDKGALEEAAAEYRLALRRDPGHYWSHFQLGRCLLSLGKASEAVEALGACIAVRPFAPWGYNARGLALGLQGRHADARADLDKALELAPDFGPARLNRGVVAWLAKDERAALADFEALLAAPAERRLIEAAFYQAQIHVEKGRHADALAALDVVAASGRKIRLVHLLRARSLFHLGREARALEALDAYVADAHPGLALDGGPAAARRGRLLLDVAGRLPAPKSGQTLERARVQLLRAVAKGERTGQVFDDLGTVCEYQGENDEAVKAYSLALEKDGKNVKTRVKRAWAYEKLQPPQLAKCRDDFQAVLENNAAHAEAHSGLGYVQASLGQSAEAVRHANLAMLHGGGDYLILHNVACIYARLARTDKGQRTRFETLAIDQLRRAVELWKRDGSGPDELRQIEAEAAFSDELKERPEFKELLKGKGVDRR